MDRSYKKAEKVNVYVDQAAKDSGQTHDCILRVPYSRAGFDYYEFKGKVYPGYLDPVHQEADACIILTDEPPRYLT